MKSKQIKKPAGIPAFVFNIQFFGGKGGGTPTSQQYRKRDPEPQELSDLRLGIFNKIFPNLQSYDPSRWETAQGIADEALSKQKDLLGSVESYINTNSGKSDSIIDEMLGVTRSGNIPTELADRMNASVTKSLQGSMGDMLNSLGNRGVLNSSITGAGISNLSGKAADAYNTNYLNAYDSVLGGYGSALQGVQGNLTAGTQGLLGAASGLGSIGTQAFENAGAQLMPAYNLWKDWQGSYDSREDFDTVVNQKKGKK